MYKTKEGSTNHRETWQYMDAINMDADKEARKVKCNFSGWKNHYGAFLMHRILHIGRRIE